MRNCKGEGEEKMKKREERREEFKGYLVVTILQYIHSNLKEKSIRNQEDPRTISFLLVLILLLKK